MPAQMRVLILEDVAADAELMAAALEQAGVAPAWQRVEREADFLEALEPPPDVILADCMLPGFDALRALEHLQRRGLDVPFIVVTGVLEEMAVECVRRGAADYLLKSQLHRLGQTVRRALDDRGLRAGKRAAEQALRESEERYRIITENINDAVFLLDMEGRIVLANRRAEDLTGYRIEALVGRPIFPLLAPEYLGGAVARLEAVRAGHEVEPVVTSELIRKDGERIWVEVNVNSIVREGRVVGRLGVARDITLRKRSEEALAARARQQAAVARLGEQALAAREITPLASEAVKLVADTLAVERCALLELSPDGKSLLVRAGVGIRDEAAGRTIVSLGADSGAQRALRSEDPVAMEADSAGRPGSIAEALALRGVHGGLAVQVEGQGGPFGMLGVWSLRARSFSEDDANFLHAMAHVLATAIARQRLEAQLLQAEKVASMGQLLAGVAHEMNNPLAVVLGQAGVLREALGGGPHADRAEKIVRAADRCARIVRNFLALARSQPPERHLADLNEIVREALELMAYPLRVDDVTVTLDLARDLPVITADPHQLHQVVVNLVSNSHQAMRRADPPRRLMIETRHDQAAAQLCLIVTDSGPGIPAEVLPHIFEPFFTTKPPGEGTGLGLPLCRSLVEAHGGSLAVHSVPGHGATFTMTLPVVMAPPSAPALGGTLGPEAPASRGPRAVLVVDDEADVAGLLGEILATEGLTVDTASSGLVALERIGERAYDVILSDLRMPGLDGPGLYRELQRLHPALCRKMIFLTGDALTAETRQFVEGLGVPTLAKPFSVGDVVAVVRRALADA